VFQFRVLRRVFEPKWYEETGVWRRLHNEELNGLTVTKFYSGDQIKTNEVGRARCTYGREKRCI
jgi:hypothetical protein